ncbi:hypothetical protein QZH41_013822, partial [Actinostola sp. cb2023]
MAQRIAIRSVVVSQRICVSMPREVNRERLTVASAKPFPGQSFTALEYLLRLAQVCGLFVILYFWKSLQGLDYISSSGTEAFEDLLEVTETLGDIGQGMGWAKRQQLRLCESKRYLKSDY